MNSQPNFYLYEFEGFVLDPLQRVVRTKVDGQTLRLTARAFDALQLLVEHHGQLVDKETLIKALWPKVVVEENNLNQVIRSLRQALGEKPGEHRFIATAPGRGYRFVAAVREVPRTSTSWESTPTATPPNGVADSVPVTPTTEMSSTQGVNTATKTSRTMLRWGVLAAVSIVAVTALWVLAHRGTAGTPPLQQTAASAATPRSSVAVLPFVNLTGDASKDYLGDGMAEELINTLTKVPGLKVPARTSSFSYKERNLDARQIAKDLGVDTILEGSVRAAGKRVRITAQLINAQDGLHMWSETYDEEITDLFKLQDDLATAIVQALQVNLRGASPASITQPPPTQDVEAYQLYLQAKFLLDTKNRQRAVELAERAVTRDPTFARAYGALAYAHLVLYQTGQASEHLLAAKKFAGQGLALDPNEPLALGVLAHLNVYAGEWPQMELRERAILAFASTDASSIVRRAIHLVGAGKLGAAVETSLRAYQLAPANARVAATLARNFHEQGRNAEALKFADLARDLGLPESDNWLVVIYEQAARDSGEYPRAMKLFIDNLSGTLIDENSRRVIVVVVQQVHKAFDDEAQRGAALTALKHLYPTLQKSTANASVLVRHCMLGVRWYVLLNDVDDAFGLAMHCPDFGGGSARGAAANAPLGDLWGPDMRPFRRDPRFQQFANHIGLMEYWKQYGPPDDCEFLGKKLTCH